MNEPKLRFPEFKDIWNNHKIEDMFDRVGTPVDLDDTLTYREIGIRSHGKGIFHKDETTASEIGNKRIFWVKPDCFVVNIVFAWERAVAKTTEAENGMIASHRFPMYKPKKDVVDLDYITEYFITKRGQNVLILASPGGAGRNKTLGQKEFAKSVVSCKIDHFTLITQSKNEFEMYSDFASYDDYMKPVREYKVNIRRLWLVIRACVLAYYRDNKDKFNFFQCSILEM